VSGKINIALSVKESAAKGEVHRRESHYTLNKCDIVFYYYSRVVNELWRYVLVTGALLSEMKSFSPNNPFTKRTKKRLT
jgi:hypothetical protein